MSTSYLVPAANIAAGTTLVFGTQYQFETCTGYSSGIYLDINPEGHVANSAQKRANQNYRARLTQRGLTRFEIMALEADRELIRSLARRLSEDGPEAEQLRTAVRTAVAGEPPKPSSILSALRRSPLIGADLDVSRAREDGRKVEL